MGYITAVVAVRQVAGDQPWPQLPPILTGRRRTTVAAGIAHFRWVAGDQP